jgi:hypothetical protein
MKEESTSRKKIIIIILSHRNSFLRAFVKAKAYIEEVCQNISDTTAHTIKNYEKRNIDMRAMRIEVVNCSYKIT